MIYVLYLLTVAAVVWFSILASRYIDMIDRSTKLSGAFLGGVLALISYWVTMIFIIGVIVLGIVLSYSYLMRGGVARWDSIVG